MRGSHARTAGITLVEAMVAIAILAIVATLVWGGFSQTMRNKTRVEHQLDRYHVLGLALERMSRELSAAFVSAQHNPDPSLQVVHTAFVGTDRGARDRIDFTSFSHYRLVRDAHESDQNELSYFVTRHPDDSSRRVLARREQGRIDDKPREGGTSHIIIDDIEEFDLQYLDPLTNEWLRTWDSTQPAMQPNRLPSQVRIRVAIPHPIRKGKTLTLGTRASIPLQWALNHATYNP